jgi:predicted amidohydrolase
MKVSKIVCAVQLLLLLVQMHPVAEARKTGVKIAMAQIFGLDGDRDGNFRRIENAIQQAKQNGAQLVLFPETIILGWVNPDAWNRSFPIPGPNSDLVAALAIKYDISVAIGMAEKEDNNLYDSAILVDNTGNILLKHRKINILSNLMTPPYTPGKEVKAVQTTQFGNVGILICADTFENKILHRMKVLSPDIVLVPYGWAAPSDQWPDHGKQLLQVVQHASQYMNTTVIGTDLIGEISHGPWTGYVYGGQSVAVTQDGRVLLGRDRDSDLIVVSV